MSERQLSPCPDCGGECYHPDSLECVWIECRVCGYALIADTAVKASAYHERLAGVCEWARTLIGSVSYLSNGCTGRGVQRSRFCPDCGKKVEAKG